MKFIVFGLGNFGGSLGRKLVSFGHEVIGVDIKMALVEKWKTELTHTVALDAGVPEAVRTLPLRDVDAALNCIGENEGANIMLSAILKQLAVRRVICRIITPLQKTVLQAMEIQEFFHPEEDSAERMAYRLDLKGVADSYKINEKYQLIEVDIPVRYIDQKVGEVPFAEKYAVLPVTVIRGQEEKNLFGARTSAKNVAGILTPETILRKGDRLLLFGEVSRLEDFVED